MDTIAAIGMGTSRRRKNIVSKKTPVTYNGMRKYDHLPPEIAIYKAWTTPGNEPRWNRRRKQDVYDGMPLLARALDRLAEEFD